MPRAPNRIRQEARRLFLSGEVTTNAEIAAHLKVKPHTVALWRRQEGWDDLRLKVDKQAAEKLVEKLANDRVTLNANHYKLWGLVVSRLLEALKSEGSEEKVKNLDKVAGILSQAQKGQRLARGLALDGQTEEQIRAEAEAENRKVVDLFLEVVKTEIEDKNLRDRIARGLLQRLPTEPVEEEAG